MLHNQPELFEFSTVLMYSIQMSFSATKNLARWLLAHECSEVNPSEATVRAAIRVCEKLRESLSMLAGVAGYSALLSRALALAKRDVPSLGAVQVREDGTLDWPDGGPEWAGDG